jgi:two-component system, chemotaxis family, sensor kinase CheA
MEIHFDITQEELPIFLAENEEQLQILDDGLVRLEREGENNDLLQALFRAAHTLKGAAGMIGHKRLVALTHALETAFDNLRKGTLGVSTPFIDLCLEAVDALRLLCEEVTSAEVCPVEVEGFVDRFGEFVLTNKTDQSNTNVKIAQENTTKEHKPQGNCLNVRASVAVNSIAPAARAFQCMLALQEAGKILEMNPSQEAIESALPVKDMAFLVETTQTPEEIEKALRFISEIENISISNEKTPEVSAVSEILEPLIQGKLKVEEKQVGESENTIDKIGEYMVNNHVISQSQVEQALEFQKNGSNTGEPPMIGQILVKMGILSQEKMDAAVAGYIQSLKGELESAKSSSNEKTNGPVAKLTADKTVRTSVERLDNLMNLVGELITDRNRLYQIRSRLEGRFRGDSDVDIFAQTTAHVGRITDQLQNEVMGIRMVPISSVFNKFPRMVRDLSNKLGKKINLTIRGEDTELDRSVIEEINDPLIHLLRNSLDHGVETPQERLAHGKPETGEVLLSARHEQGRIILTVEDDGEGIDPEKIRNVAVVKGVITESEAAVMSPDEAMNLIFYPGFTTAKIVSDVSGRGVGLDIVRNNIQHLNGSIQLESKPGQGTHFEIILPLTLAIVPTLLVVVGPSTLAITLVTVLETLRITENEIKSVNSRPVITLRNRVLPLMSLGDAFELHSTENNGKHKYVVVVGAGKLQMGLLVDRLIGEDEVVVKSLGRLIGEIPGISSAAVLGDGQVILILDIQDLFKLGGSH